MATGKKDDNREAELEAADREDQSRDVEARPNAAQAAARDCADPAKPEDLLSVKESANFHGSEQWLKSPISWPL